MAEYATMPLEQLHDALAKVTDFKERGKIITEITKRTRAATTIEDKEVLWPSKQMREREEFAGLYPDPIDPLFAARLYQKKEFYEARALAAGLADGSIDPCSSSAANSVFELTPVQRIVARFMHPRTPFNGLLLNHGVGVGKTCSAVTIAENFLAQNPSKKVIVIAPQALRENFLNTVFDISKLTWSAEEGQWKIQQCTGINYLERLNLLNEPDIKTVTLRIKEDIRNRYKVSGYLEFVNWLRKKFTAHISSSITDPAARAERENEMLRLAFSDHMIIIDEAHNLRDLTENSLEPQAVTETTTATGQDEDNAGGKALNPLLKRIAIHAEGLKIVLMTATPMYNSAPEIILLLNILLLNDTKNEDSSIKIYEVFTKEGDLKEGAALIKLEKAARAYVSYMRGENPYTFPLRMSPPKQDGLVSEKWPTIPATSNPVTFSAEELQALDVLPLVLVTPVVNSPVEMLLREATTRGFTETEDAPIADKMLDTRMQIANFSYPNSSYGTTGFTHYFTSHNDIGSHHKIKVFKYTPQEEYPDVDLIFKGEALKMHAPKIHQIVENLVRSKGICFVYSRYINSGALPLAIALERMGFQRRLGDGSISPLLRGSTPVPPICAVCGKPNSPEHTTDHPFSPACYILLTSSEEIAPQFPSLVRQAVTWDKADPNGPRGTNVKVIIGSQVASEGLDLKCVREVHILDPWYHLNRIDQIVGRAIRYCSHSALPVEERNCLIYLYATLVEETSLGPALETADLYAYRLAIGKAQKIGKVQRLLKRHAWDCNLELEAITFSGLPTRRQIDSQGNVSDEYNINDQDFTTYCDYQACRHECKVTVRPEDLKIDDSSYQFEDARSVISRKHAQVRRLFDSQIMVPEIVVKEIFKDLPWEIASEALLDLLDGRHFRLTRPDHVEGFLVKKAGYLVFQPAKIRDTEIPIALRYARGFQLTRQAIEPTGPVWTRAPPPPRATTVMRPPTVQAAESGYSMPPGGVATAEPKPGNALYVEKPPPADDDPLSMTYELRLRWENWLKFVTNFSDVDTKELSAEDASSYRLWEWILLKFIAVGDDIIKVAIQWWIDRALEFTEQRALNEVCLTSEDFPGIEYLRDVFSPRHFKNAKITSYIIYNPDTEKIECYILNKEKLFKQPAPTMSGFVFDRLIKPITLISEMGSLTGAMGILFGINALKDKKGQKVLSFKTVDLSSGLTSKTKGAECAILSNVGPARERIKLLQDIIESVPESDLNPCLLDPDTTVKRAAGDKEKHFLGQLSKDDGCLYLEFLTRIMDRVKIGGKRWYLDAIDTVVSWDTVPGILRGIKSGIKPPK